MAFGSRFPYPIPATASQAANDIRASQTPDRGVVFWVSLGYLGLVCDGFTV